jgi:uncharacterized protein YbbC (DUF1343 family)
MKLLSYRLFLQLYIIISFFGFTFFSGSELSDKHFLIKSINQITLGNEVLLNKYSELIAGKSIGLITNKSGILSNGKLFADALYENKDVKLTTIFTPEHGFRGDDNDNNGIDQKTGSKIISLYGNKLKPSKQDLEDIDYLIYDIQDAGARFYTYISTLYYCIQSVYENKKYLIVCDRPIIANPDYVDGFLLQEEFKSFVGLIDIPIAYGMTCGELAIYINDKYFGGEAPVQIIKMDYYNRNYDYESLNLKWVKPSPSMYFSSTAKIYQGTCLLEGTNFSEGRGSDKPFEYIGAPYCDSKLLKRELDTYGFDGVDFEEIEFTPGIIPDTKVAPKYKGEKCNGIYINITDSRKAEPVKIGIAVLISLNKLFREFKWTGKNFIDKLAGTDVLRKKIESGVTLDIIVLEYKLSLELFRKIRLKYLLY